jgi:nucleoside-diphosphate-sugar epimerase
MLDCERRPSATSPSPESRTPRSITCPMRVLIAGCRYVDSALDVLLAAEAHPVLGLRRDTSKLSSPITPVQVDCSSPLPSDTLPPNLDALVYSASPSGSTDEAYRAAYVDGARNVISALESQ